MKKYWVSEYGFDIGIELTDALRCSQAGDMLGNVIGLAKKSYIAKQVARWDSESVKLELLEYGAWGDENLSNDKQNVIRALWIACCDIRDEESGR